MLVSRRQGLQRSPASGEETAHIPETKTSPSKIQNDRASLFRPRFGRPSRLRPSRGMLPGPSRSRISMKPFRGLIGSRWRTQMYCLSRLWSSINNFGSVCVGHANLRNPAILSVSKSGAAISVRIMLAAVSPGFRCRPCHAGEVGQPVDRTAWIKSSGYPINQWSHGRSSGLPASNSGESVIRQTARLLHLSSVDWSRGGAVECSSAPFPYRGRSIWSGATKTRWWWSKTGFERVVPSP